MKKINNEWCVKNDGSQLFKDTVIKYLNEKHSYYQHETESLFYGEIFINSTQYRNISTTPFGKQIDITQFIKESGILNNIRYWKFICSNNRLSINPESFIENKIYKLNSGKNITDFEAFTDEYSYLNGYSEFNLQHFIPSTEEEFNKQNNIMEKEIIKYRVKKEFKDAFMDINGWYRWDGELSLETTFYKRAIELKVLDIWFDPIYKEEKEKLYIGNNEYEIIILGKDKTEIAGYIFNKDFWEGCKKTLLNSPGGKTSIKIGCNHPYSLSLDLINKVLERLNG